MTALALGRGGTGVTGGETGVTGGGTGVTGGGTGVTGYTILFGLPALDSLSGVDVCPKRESVSARAMEYSCASSSSSGRSDSSGVTFGSMCSVMFWSYCGDVYVVGLILPARLFVGVVGR